MLKQTVANAVGIVFGSDTAVLILVELEIPDSVVANKPVDHRSCVIAHDLRAKIKLITPACLDSLTVPHKEALVGPGFR